MSRRTIYDQIGKSYNFSRKADPYITHRLYELLISRQEGIYLDIGCGTGNYTIALAKKGICFYGIDPSRKMLAIAAANSNNVRWLNGTAEAIPAHDDLFNGAIAILTIHHWDDLGKGIKELARILKPGGRLVIFTATPEQMQGYWLNHYFPSMIERSMLQMPSQEIISKALFQAGFVSFHIEKYFITNDLNDYFLYSGKHHPEYYFDADIRDGISSFAAIANQSEIASGLKHLKTDLANKNFEQIKNSYSNDEGDYLFIIAECG